MMIFGILLSFVSFVAFPESNEAIFSNTNKDLINIDKSGSLGIYYNGKCHKTFGNETIVSNENSDWCSNMAKDKKDPLQNPWIQYSIKGKQLKVKKYSVRNGCCGYYECCCENDGSLVEYGCCCALYSYSLRASNDNKTWKVLHKVEKDKNFNFCETKTFEIVDSTTPYTFFRFMLDEEWPNCPKCLQINQLELYGETVASSSYTFSDSSDDDESISIIGRIKKSEQ